MPKNRVQFQKGLGIPAGGGNQHCRLGSRTSACQFKRCKRRVTLLAGTTFQAAKVPLTLWFLVLYLLSQARNGISAPEPGPKLGVSPDTARLLKHKLTQVMQERDAHDKEKRGERQNGERGACDFWYKCQNGEGLRGPLGTRGAPRWCITYSYEQVVACLQRRAAANRSGVVCCRGAGAVGGARAAWARHGPPLAGGRPRGEDQPADWPSGSWQKVVTGGFPGARAGGLVALSCSARAGAPRERHSARAARGRGGGTLGPPHSTGQRGRRGHWRDPVRSAPGRREVPGGNCASNTEAGRRSQAGVESGPGPPSARLRRRGGGRAARPAIQLCAMGARGGGATMNLTVRFRRGLSTVPLATVGLGLHTLCHPAASVCTRTAEDRAHLGVSGKAAAPLQARRLVGRDDSGERSEWRFIESARVWTFLSKESPCRISSGRPRRGTSPC